MSSPTTRAREGEQKKFTMDFTHKLERDELITLILSTSLTPGDASVVSTSFDDKHVQITVSGQTRLNSPYDVEIAVQTTVNAKRIGFGTLEVL